MSFFVAKGITAVLKDGAEIMVHRLAYGESTGSNPDNDHRIGATCCHFRKIHCRTADNVFFCAERKRNSNN